MIETAIQKLINEYEQKILDADKSIERATEKVRNARNNGEDGYFEKKEMYEWQARKMAYCQAKADIDSLLDHA